MWQLNDQWERNRAKLAELEQKVADGMNINPQWIEEARLQVARDNEHAMAINNAQADRQAQEAAARQRVEERRNAVAQRAADEFRVQARAAWTGDDASFEAVFPRLLEEHRIQQAQQRLSGQAALHAPRVRL